MTVSDRAVFPLARGLLVTRWSRVVVVMRTPWDGSLSRFFVLLK